MSKEDYYTLFPAGAHSKCLFHYYRTLEQQKHFKNIALSLMAHDPRAI